MGIFSRHRPEAVRIPTAGELEAFGRYSLMPLEASPDVVRQASAVEVDYYQHAIADPTKFVRELRQMAETYREWVALGASRLVVSLLGADHRTPDSDAIMGCGVDCLRARGIPKAFVTGYESSWWFENGAGQPWLVGRPAPQGMGTAIAPLRPGEVRRIAHMGPKGNNNNILVTASEVGFAALIEGPYSEEDPRVARQEWYSAPTLHELYIRVGDALATPPPWCAAEFEPYIPLPAPDFS
jgi:hypothetical protein